MTTHFAAFTVPKSGTDARSETQHQKLGFALALVGLVLVAITLIANIGAANSASALEAAEIGAWSFGLTTLAFGTIKLGIAIVLIGILVRLWIRVQSVNDALPDLKGPGAPDTPKGDVGTDYGAAVETAGVPNPLPIHKMARTMWFPMLVMGYPTVIAGFVVSIAWSTRVADGTQQAASAWAQGLQFLGEGLLLAGISMLLGSILASLREGGGSVQHSLGLAVRTLRMPRTAKLFVLFMAAGLMVSMLQFVLYIVAASVTNPQSFAAWSAWLGPFREFGLGLLLAGIVLALVTIGNVLGFQFSRIRQIVATGK